ncbi:hypothetical protein BU17DRAFT_60277 [Hysterangium stoloniferum]|nr:hypothetical protein BU17DRAFT_60277 [Hysterangium stoloniferum]
MTMSHSDGPSPIGNADYVCWAVTPPGNIIFLDYIFLVIFETSIRHPPTAFVYLFDLFSHLNIDHAQMLSTFLLIGCQLILLAVKGILYYVYLIGLTITLTRYRRKAYQLLT